ncbi:MAG TPA: hypothetical protein VE176_14415, partial [Candidatus Limnocylindrales bacterium]|nr:hypothetical protein [Candidatus Limnocylindrales bacterium]
MSGSDARRFAASFFALSVCRFIFLSIVGLESPDLGSILLLLDIGPNPIRNLWRVFKVANLPRGCHFTISLSPEALAVTSLKVITY